MPTVAEGKKMTKDHRKYTLEEDQNTCHTDTQNNNENDEIKNIVIAVENSNMSPTWTPAEVITKTHTQKVDTTQNQELFELVRRRKTV